MAGKKQVASLFVELRATSAKFRSDMKSISDTVNATGKAMQRTFGTLNKVLAVGGLVVGINKLSGAFGTLITKGEELGSVRVNFQKLGGSVAVLESARKSTLGMVSALDLMKIANEGAAKQIPGFTQNLDKIAELGARMANALGTDTKGAIEKVTQAFATASNEQLRQIGIVIDQDRAYKDYAKSIGQTADVLSDAQKVEARQLAAMSELGGAIEKLAPLSDSAKNAQTALQQTINDTVAIIGEQINASVELQDAFRALDEVIRSIDWGAFGESAASAITTVVTVSKDAVSVISKLGEEIDVMMGVINTHMSRADLKSTREMAKGLNEYDVAVKQATSALVQLDAISSKYAASGRLTGDEAYAASIALKKLESALGGNKTAAAAYGKQLEMARADVAKWGQTAQAVLTPTIKFGDASEKSLQKAAKSAQEAAKALNTFNKAQNDLLQKELSKSIEASIDKLDKSKFNKFIEDYRNAVQEGHLLGQQDAIKKGVPESDLRAQGARMAEIEVSEYSKKFQEESEKAYKESIDTWQTLFENAITGVTFDLKDALKQVAVGFAAELAQSLFGSLGSDIKNPKDIGSAIFKDIFGTGSGSSNTAAFNLGALFGINAGLTTEQAHSQGMQGPGDAQGNFDTGVGSSSSGAQYAMYAAAALQVAKDAQNKKSEPDPHKRYFETGTDSLEGLVSRIVLAFGTFGISEIALGIYSQMGGSQPLNRETQQRHKGVGGLEQQLNDANAYFLDANGNPAKFNGNLIEGKDTRFSNPAWADAFNASSTGSVFGAVGKGLQELLGLTEKVGDQIGMILWESLGQNADNARLLIKQLGITQEEFNDALVKMGEEGKLSWLEVEIAIKDAGKAFGEGLVEVGAFGKAFDQIIASGGDGLDAIESVKNAAVEAAEADIKTFDEWKQALLDAGKDPEMVNALFKGLADRNLDSFDKIKEASSRTIGGVVADMQAASPKLMEQWMAAQQAAQSYVDTIESIPDNIEKNLTINVHANIDSGAEGALNTISGGADTTTDSGATAFARGGIVTKPTMGLIGEAGAEAVLPLSRLPSMMRNIAAAGGGSGGNTYNLDLRGAAPGVGDEVRRALRELENGIIAKAVNAVGAEVRRGGNYSRILED